jgi:hypothetical protein
MARIERKWSDRQRDAIVAAQLEHGRTAAQAAELAAGGALQDGAGYVPAFGIPARTAGQYATDGRRRLREQLVREAVIRRADTSAHSLAELVAAELERDFAHVAAKKPGAARASELRAILAAAGELARVVRSTSTPAPAQSSSQSSSPGREQHPAGGLITAARRRREERTPEHEEPHPEETSHAGATHATTENGAEELEDPPDSRVSGLRGPV